MKMKVKLGTLILAGSLCVLGVLPAFADSKIPPARAGKVKVEVRFYHSGRVFSPSSFGFQTLPSKSRFTETQVKITGEHGLGGKWALLYHLRIASLRKAKKHATFTAFGLQDQTIGLERGFRQRNAFADAVAFKIILPTGSTTSIPQLGVGHLAVEPDYEFGFTRKFGKRFAYGNSSVGPRVFTNSGVTLVRVRAEVGGRLVSKVNIFGTLFLSRAVGGNATSAKGIGPNASEIFNLARGGGGLEFAISKALRPMVAYETDFAGQSIHAGSRIVFGITWRYKLFPF